MARRLTLLAALPAVLVGPLAAQQLRPGLLVGRVLDAEGASVGGAVIRATQGARTYLTEAQDDGDYRIAGLAAGRWTVSVRRLGFQPMAVEIEMPAEGLRRNLTLVARSTTLDPVLVAEKWTGIRGLVGDARGLDPLAGASIRLLGSDATTGSDTAGAFAIGLPGGRSAVLRVERAGFATRIVSLTVPESGYVELDVALDTTEQEGVDYWKYRDLDQRLKFASNRAVFLGRDDIAATDAVSLGTALQFSRAVAAKGVQVDRRACVYINGVARPGYPVDAIRAGEVEFVEAYPPGTDLTRTLAMRWPSRAPCGSGAGPTAVGANARQLAQFVSVWLRAP